MSSIILRVAGLKTYFYTANGIVKAVDGVSFDIEKGEVFGIAGESGSGKTLTALSILKLIAHPCRIMAGSVLFEEKDLLIVDEETLRSIRGSKISMVFQEPSSSFNPVFTIGEQIVETITAHRSIGREKAKAIAMEYLSKVHVNEVKKVFNDYPHQLSGGTKQRAMIAMALVNSPQLLILDEPTSALDVTIQAQVLDLLQEIIRERKLSILFISHDLGIIARMCGRVAVMRKGIIVEMGDTRHVLSNPRDAYTAALLNSVKVLS